MEQAGSYNDKDRLRFDFSHFQAMTPEEIAEVEEIVNKEIAAGLPVVTQIMTVDEAKKTGAMALFGEKYGEKVRVVSMGDFSREFCAVRMYPTQAISRPSRLFPRQVWQPGCAVLRLSQEITY